MLLQENSESAIHSLTCGLRGLKLVLTPGLRRYTLLPVLMNFILFAGAFWLSGAYFAEFLEWLIPSWLDWLRWLLWPVFGLSFLLFMMFSFSLVANILGSPFYGRLARKVELQIIGDSASEGKVSEEPGWLAQIASEIRRLLYFLSRAIPLLLLFLIPGVNLIAPFLWFCFSAWFLGMEYMAHPLEEDGMTFPLQRRLMSPYRFNVTVFGGLALMGLAVPLLNLFVPPAAVIGATLYVHDKKTLAKSGPQPM